MPSDQTALLPDEVHVAPTPDSDLEEAGEATTLVSEIKKNIADLDAESLEVGTLNTLHSTVGRLAEIAEMREARRRDTLRLQSKIEEWEASKSEKLKRLVDPVLLGDILGSLKESAIDIGQEGVEAILADCDEALAIENRFREKGDSYQQAIKENNYELVSSLALAMKSLEGDRDAAYVAIRKTISEQTRTIGDGKAKSDADAKSEEETKDDDPEAHRPEPERETEATADPLLEDHQESPESEATLDSGVGDGSSSKLPVDGTREVDEGPIDEPSVQQPTLDDREVSVEQIEAGIATAIKRGRFGLAYHLACDMPEVLSSKSAVAFVASNYVTDESAPVVDELLRLAEDLRGKPEEILAKKSDLVQRNHATLIASAALSPALVTPRSWVTELLNLMEPRLADLPSLRELVQSAREASLGGAYLPVERFREDSLEEWKEKAEALQKKGRAWVEAERRSKIKYRRATKVWYRILDDWEDERCHSIGRVFKLLEEPIDHIIAVIENRTKYIESSAAYWRQHGDREIDRIDRSIRPAVSTNDIAAGARLRLQEKINEAIVFFDQWCRLFKVRPTQEHSYSYHKEWKNKLCNTLQEYSQAALQEIASLDTPIAYRAEDLLRRYIARFEDDAIESPTSRMRLQDLLNGDLFADPSVRFDDSAYPSKVSLETGRLLNLVRQNELDFPSAIIERAKYGDFGGVEMTLDFVERAGCLNEDTIDRIRFQVDSEREQVEKKLKKRIRDTRDRLDAAYAHGTLTKEEVDKLHCDIPSDGLSEVNDLEPYFKECKRIGQEIEESQQKRQGKATKRLELLKKNKKVKLEDEDIERIEKVIKADSYQVADDYIERIERGESLPEHELRSGRAFDHFFPQFIEEYITFFKSGTPDTLEQIRSALEKRQHMGPVDATSLSVNSASDGANFIKTWAELRSGNMDKSLFKALMRALGFTGVEVSNEKQTNTGGKEFVLQTAPIANRRITQLPDFGSRANGRYRLASSNFEYSTVEAIVQTVKQSKIPTIVLFWDILDIGERRELAHNLSFGTYEPALVLDEALITFLATKSGERRLSAFFDCASAFSFSQPFDPEAIEVPPEMFFGRETERRAILNMSGEMTHLVYGGRRLGKTVLFRDIEREYKESENELVLFLSLRGSEIGQNQQTDQLWSLFAKKLGNHNIVDSRTLRPDSVGSGVKKWLKENSSRRILFLVDEADDFLDAEQKSGYQVLEQIKNLMEDTKRKFKVVFAGLHNVQRATRDPNNPFSHMMGRPVRIGPMLPDTEPTLIESLIRDPLETLGYRFDSTDSVIRIAAETNYYPALAQLFCKDLLHNLRENDLVGPPYTIRREDIDRVFDSRETRDRIRDLFRWTIQLDPRYEFLTYLIARESFDNEDIESSSVSIEDIRNISLEDWSQGFDSDKSFWIFEVLLEEMVGLGILREMKDQRFSIRTRNLRMLLGNDDEIKQRYDDAKDRDPLEHPHPSEFRRTINGRPAPLTAGQENKLLSTEPSVGLIFGSCLAGLDQVRQSLKQLCESLSQNDRTGGPPIELHDASDATSLRSKLRQASKRRRGFHIVLVDRGAWDRSLIGEALEFVSRHRARNRTIRPVFLGGPAEAWLWLKESLPRRKDNAVLWDIWLGPCDKNFARTWLMKEESPAQNDLANRDRMFDLPWPVVVEVAARERSLKSIEEATCIALADQDLVSDILRLPETESALIILSNMFPHEMTPDDLSDLSEEPDISPEESLRILDWASRLGIVQDREGYRLDSAYAIGLKAIFEV